MKINKLTRVFKRKKLSIIPPLILFLLLAFILSFLWFHDREQHQQALEDLTRVMADQVSFRLESWINQRLSLADYLALNWVDQYARSPKKFSKDVNNLFKIYPGIQAINWIDSNWIIRIVNPIKGNEGALNKDLHAHPSQKVKQAITRAMTTKNLTCTSVIPLFQGGKGFASYKPVFANDQLLGFINIVFKTDTLIRYCLNNPFLQEHFNLLIETVEDDTIFHSTHRQMSAAFLHASGAQIGDKIWKIKISPSSDFIKSQLAVTRNKYFILNLIFTLAIALLMWILVLRHLKLKQNERQFRSLFESANIWIHLLKKDGAIIQANPFFYQQTGLSPGKIEGKNFLQFLNAKSRRIFSQWLETIEENPEFRSELEFKMNGRIKAIIDCSGIVIRNELDQPESVVLYSNNVTDKKKFEKALNESEEKYRQIVEQSHDAIFIYRKNKFLFVNNSLEEISEYQKDELYEIDVLQLIHEEDRPRLTKFAQARKKGDFAPYQYTARIVTKSGKIKICEFNVNTITYQGKQAILGSVRDVTREQEARQALEASEKRYRNLFENVPVGLYRINEKGELLAANPATLKLIGCQSFEEARSINFFSFYMDETSHTLWKNLLKFSEKQHTHETRLRKIDGTVIWVRDTAKVYRDPESGGLFIEGVLEDITEQKKAQDRLIESERRFKEMANLLPQCVFESNTSLRLTYVNSFATRLTGYSQLEMLQGMKILEWFPQGQQQKALEFFEAVLNFKTPPSNEFLALRKDGQLFPVLIFATPILKREEVTGLRGVLVDISERKRMENALRESEARYRSLVEQSPDAIVVHESGRILFANQAARKIYKAQTLEQMYNRPVMSFVHPDSRELVKRRLLEAATNGKGTVLPLIQEKHIALDGTELDVEVVGTRVEYQGRMVNLAIIRDITEQLKYQRALQESEGRFKSILTSMVDIVLLFDPQGKLLFYNAPEAEELNFNLKSYIGRPIFRLLPRAMKLQLKPTIHKLNRGQTVKLEFNLEEKNAGIKWFSANVTPMLIEEKIHGYVAVVRDITERKESELKLSQALSEKEILLQEVHHRVKNNLQSLFYLIQMNKNQVSDLNSREIFNNLQNQLRAMSLVYEQLYHSTNLAAIDMKTYLQSLMANVHQTFLNVEDVKLILNIDDLTLSVDKALPCGLIINELVSNSFKYAFNDSAGPKEIHVRLNQRQGRIQLTVSDNGAGFSPPRDLTKLKSMGLKLVHLWATHQLGGTLKIDNQNGAKIIVEFGL
ncbi:PAS domain S-box protein [Calditrichota bacterium GD2]